MPEISDLQLATLRTFCDTIVPAVGQAEDPSGFWARRATDVGADLGILQVVDTLAPEQAQGLLGLLDELAAQGFESHSQASREQLLTNFSLGNRDAAVGIGMLTSLALFFTYGIVDPATGRNPSWEVFGYPGPISPVPEAARAITPLRPEGDTTLEADAVIVGSGAGGSVIAGRLAEAGLKVVVLEAGGYFSESDFNQTEIWGYENLYWRGGPTPTGDLNVALQAGACLGGGTVVNWTNCLRTKDWVREEWANEHGLEDIATEAFDRHLDAVWERLGVTDACSELNGPHQRLKEGSERLGWSFADITRNWDPERHDPRMAGYMGFGDQSGAKRSTLSTYLRDAAEHGAEIVVNCFAERILVESGRAAGVEATYTDRETGATAQVTVRAAQVVVAAGTLESPGLLLRSGLGGPAAGDYLRVHPCTATVGDYGTDQQAWWGAPQAALVDEFVNVEDGHGFLVEGVQYTTALAASAIPWTTGSEHKALMENFRNCATFIGLLRDHGHGRVTIDGSGTTVPYYSLDDPLDRRTTHRSLEAQIRLHAAAGARRVILLAAGAPHWKIGEDLDAFIRRCQRVPLRAGGMKLFAAHQMGTCRMGRDPQTSVADPHGELHETPGVWIGDASAFPSASGTNPMITIMALASRTAEHIAQAAGRPATAATAA